MEKFNTKALGSTSIALGNITPEEYASVSHLLKERNGEYLCDQSALDKWIEATFTKHGWPYYKGMAFSICESDLMVSHELNMDLFYGSHNFPDKNLLASYSLRYLEEFKDFLYEIKSFLGKGINDYFRSRPSHLHYELMVSPSYDRRVSKYCYCNGMYSEICEIIAQKEDKDEI